MSEFVMSELEIVRREYIALSIRRSPPHRKLERTSNAPKEFDQLCADPRVRFVAVVDSDVIVGTHPLVMHISRPGMEPRLLGEMLLTLRTQKHAFFCENVSHPYGRADKTWVPHPHIHSSGVPCFGSPRPLHIETWFVDAKFAHLVMFMLDFFERAQGEQHYVDPECWPPYKAKEHLLCSAAPHATTSSSVPQASIPAPSRSLVRGLVARLRSAISQS